MLTILITGVTDGIGRALAEHYAGAGARVLGVGRRSLDATQPGIFPPGAYCQVDLVRPDAAETVGSFLDEHGIDRLDVLVHNAASGWYGPVAEQRPDSIDELLAVNLRAPIALTHALLPRLIAARGVVAFISSVHTALPTPDFAVYTATKAALDGFTRSLRIELAGRVDVLTLWAGPTRTGIHAKSGIPTGRIKVERFASPESTAVGIAAAIPALRAGASDTRSRCTSIGANNRLLHGAGTHFEAWVDTAMIASARRRVR